MGAQTKTAAAEWAGGTTPGAGPTGAASSGREFAWADGLSASATAALPAGSSTITFTDAALPHQRDGQRDAAERAERTVAACAQRGQRREVDLEGWRGAGGHQLAASGRAATARATTLCARASARAAAPEGVAVAALRACEPVAARPLRRRLAAPFAAARAQWACAGRRAAAPGVAARRAQRPRDGRQRLRTCTCACACVLFVVHGSLRAAAAQLPLRRARPPEARAEEEPQNYEQREQAEAAHEAAGGETRLGGEQG